VLLVSVGEAPAAEATLSADTVSETINPPSGGQSGHGPLGLSEQPPSHPSTLMIVTVIPARTNLVTLLTAP